MSANIDQDIAQASPAEPHRERLHADVRVSGKLHFHAADGSIIKTLDFASKPAEDEHDDNG